VNSLRMPDGREVAVEWLRVGHCTHAFVPGASLSRCGLSRVPGVNGVRMANGTLTPEDEARRNLTPARACLRCVRVLRSP